MTLYRGMRVCLAATATVALIAAAASPAVAAPPVRTATPVITASPVSPTAATTATFEFVSTTAGATYTCQLDARTATTCLSPTTYTNVGNGSHTFSVKASKSGQKPSGTATKSWVVDSVAPNAPTVSGPSGIVNEANPAITFSSSSLDVTAYSCSLDDAAPVTCTSGATVAAAGAGRHTFSVTARDAVGNVSAATTIAWVLDASVTTPFVLSGPTSLTSATEATFAFTTQDDDATFQCSVDGSAYAACVSPATFTGLAVAGHTFRVRAADPVGNVAVSDIYNWTVGATPLSFSWSHPDALPSGTTNSTTASFDFTVLGQTTLECAVDGVSLGSCSSPVELTDLAEGRHTFVLVADKGLASESAFAFTWLIDVTPPGAPTVSAPTGRTSSTSASIVVTPAAAADHLHCAIDGAAAADCTAGTPIALTALSDGTHTVVASAVDKAGNIGQTSVSWVVDTVAPTAAATAPVAVTSPTGVTFSEDVVGTADGLALSIAGGAAVATSRVCLSAASAVVDCAGAVRSVRLAPTKALVPGQTYAVTVSPTVADLAGNPAAAASTTFRAAVLQQEYSPVMTQTWRTVATTAARGGSYIMETRAGASATWTFSGTAVALYPVMGPSFGYVAVYVDGVKKATFNQYKSTLSYTTARVIKGLASGTHTVKVVVLGTKGSTRATGAAVGIDAFAVGATVTATPKMVTSWSRARAYGALGLAQALTAQKGGAASMVFVGTGITWVHATGPAFGLAAVYVDGVLKGTVDSYSATARDRISFVVKGLVLGQHVVKIVPLGTKRAASKGTLVSLDALAVR